MSYINKVLVLGCNHDQIPYINELKKRNYYVIGSDMNPHAPGKSLCDKFYNYGYDSFDDIVSIGLKENFESNNKIFTAAAQFALIACSKFASNFNIDYISEKTINIVLDKSKFYEYFKFLKIPIPKTHYIKNENDLKNKILDIGIEKSYYLKSDFSKNPNYVYKLNFKNLNKSKIFWGKDRFLRNHYILQEEFLGEHLRINIIKDDFIIFPIVYGNNLITNKKQLIDRKVFHNLKRIVDNLNLNNWIVKFDLVINNYNYVVLDIGLDPPFRLNKYYLENKLNFPSYFIDLNLHGKSNFKLLEYEN